MKKILFYFLLVCGNALFSQDLHFSQYYKNPPLINPALSGNFDGKYRIGVNYRNQGSNVSTPYKTYAFFSDMRFTFQNINNGYFGTGISFFNDIAGDGNLSKTMASLNFSYNHYLNRKNSFIVSLGFSIGMINQSFDPNKLVFDSQWDGSTFDPGLSSNEYFKTTSNFSPNIDAGAAVSYGINSTFNLHVGGSIKHLNNIRISFYDANYIYRRTYSLYGASSMNISHDIQLFLSIMNCWHSRSNELLIGGNATYSRNELKLLLGLWHRLGRDFIPLVGFEINGFSCNISYDINVSHLRTASNYKGATEFSIIKIFRIREKGLPCSDFK